MRDRARHLHGEPETGRHAGGPSGESRRAMGTVEGGVDLDAREDARVALQVALPLRETRLLCARQAEAGRADERIHSASKANRGCSRPAYSTCPKNMA